MRVKALIGAAHPFCNDDAGRVDPPAFSSKLAFHRLPSSRVAIEVNRFFLERHYRPNPGARVEARSYRRDNARIPALISSGSLRAFPDRRPKPVGTSRSRHEQGDNPTLVEAPIAGWRARRADGASIE
jgi:hypothetical protein